MDRLTPSDDTPLTDADATPSDLPAFERVALRLRTQIISGCLRPGQALIEAELCGLLDASRNTIREALRQLRCEGLVSYHRNRGVFVRVLGLADLHDLYQIRRTLEIPALARLRYLKRADCEQMLRAIEATEAACASDDWSDVGTRSLHFHQAIVGLHGSPRLDDFFTTIVAQLRLLFVGGQQEKSFQSPWVARDREIFTRLGAQQYATAAHSLSAYLDDSEEALRTFINTQDIIFRS